MGTTLAAAPGLPPQALKRMMNIAKMMRKPRVLERKLRIQLKLNTALLSTVRVSVRSCVTGVTSHISHIYKGINAMLIIRGPIKPYIF